MNLAGKTIGDYQIESEIGRGGTSTVYRAIDLRDNKAVALKVMLPELIDNEMALRRFLREGKAAAQLHHSNIVQIYEAGQTDGHYYIAMELIRAGTLAEHIKQKGELLSCEKIIAILSQIGAALDYAHTQGIVHRDIKLSNILLTEDDRALLSDFGIAKRLFSEQTMVTAVGRAVGTPSFMSPEQITGDYDVDYRSDLYSLAVIAYILFTGRTPFTADTAHQLMYKIAYEFPTPPNIINPEVSSDISFVLLKALSKEPGERYSSAHKFVTSLSTCRSYDCEIISRQKPIESRKLNKLFSMQWPLGQNIPTEAFIGAMITLLVLTIVLSPTLSVTPKFLLTKLQEVDMLQSARLALRANQSTDYVGSISTAYASPGSGGLFHQMSSLSQIADAATDSAANLTNWAAYDEWIIYQYNALVTLLGLHGAAMGESRISGLEHEFVAGPKPSLPIISPKVLP
ncbi:MAG: serine/threonine-protein kinase [Caldilineaceae bacterium]